MSTYEVMYLAHTGRPPERIVAASHSVDDSTTLPMHRFQVRGCITSSRLIERIDVEDVREIQREPPGLDQVPESPLPPFPRQVSNRAFPEGRRPGSSG
ncbi:MAG: hypothetical protein M3Q31_06830 [Actinomycetota bacterium]|nr:hypothetical protein [Actinomycetota bacterium]